MSIKKLVAVSALVLVGAANNLALADPSYTGNWGTLSSAVGSEAAGQGYSLAANGSFDTTYNFSFATATQVGVLVNAFWGINSVTGTLTDNTTHQSWSLNLFDSPILGTNYQTFSASGGGTDFSLHVTGSGLQSASFYSSVTPVPEPETFAMLLAGLGLIGAITRRRNKTGVA